MGSNSATRRKREKMGWKNTVEKAKSKGKTARTHILTFKLRVKARGKNSERKLFLMQKYLSIHVYNMCVCSGFFHAYARWVLYNCKRAYNSCCRFSSQTCIVSFDFFFFREKQTKETNKTGWKLGAIILVENQLEFSHIYWKLIEFHPF